MPNATKKTSRTKSTDTASAAESQASATTAQAKSSPKSDSKSDTAPKSTPTPARRRRPAIKANDGDGTASRTTAQPESAKVAARVKGDDKSAQNGDSTKGSGQSSASTKRAPKKSSGGDTTPAGLKPVRRDDGKTGSQSESFAQFSRFSRMVAQTTRNANRVETRFDRPFTRGTMISSALVGEQQRDKIANAYKSVKDFEPYDVSEIAIWVNLGLNEALTHTFWLVGTVGESDKGGKIIIVRESKTGDVTLQRWTPEKLLSDVSLEIEFDAERLNYWEPEPPNNA